MFDGLFLIVLKTLLRHAVERLLGVEAVRSRVPDVAQLVDVEIAVATTLLHYNLTLLNGLTYFHEAHTCLVQQILHGLLVGVLHLNNHTGILRKEQLHRVALVDAVEVDFDTALLVSKCHFQKRGDETTGTDVVTCQEKSLLHQVLHGQEGITEIFRILHCRHVAAHLAEALRKSRTTKFQGIK